MRLLRLAEVEPSAGDRVFRYAPTRALLAASAVLGTSVVLVGLGWHARSGAVYDWVAAALALAVVLMRRFVLARFRPSNWLVRLRDDGVLIQFRSYLNYHFPADDRTVVFLPYDAIRSARLVRETSTVYFANERSQRRRRLVELEIDDGAALATALTEERARPAPYEKCWYGTSATVYQHYPVQMASPTLLQVEWGVVPGAQVLLDALRLHTTIAPSVDVSQDFTRLKAASHEEQEAYLRKLAATGQTIAAIYLARRLYGLGIEQAKTAVDGLVGRRTARG
jgi:hypothetical protein